MKRMISVSVSLSVITQWKTVGFLKCLQNLVTSS